jgi:hypothetical protein
MAKFKPPKPAVNLGMKKGAHSHLIVELDGGATFSTKDTVQSVADNTANKLTFTFKNPTPKGNRMSMRILHSTSKKKDVDPTTGILTVTITVNTVPTCVMIPVNYVTEENPCECPP